MFDRIRQWWKRRKQKFRAERVPNTTVLEATTEYDNGNKKHHYVWYWNYIDPETNFTYRTAQCHSSKVEWAGDDDFEHHAGWVNKQYGPNWEGDIIDERDDDDGS